MLSFELEKYLPSIQPLSNVTPFTYRDGLTYVELLTQLRRYITSTLTPNVDDLMKLLSQSWTEENEKLVQYYITSIGNLVELVNDELAEQDGTGTQKITDLRVRVDAQVADVFVKLKAATDQLINATIEISDPVVVGLLSNAGTRSNAIFARQRLEAEAGAIAKSRAWAPRVMGIAPIIFTGARKAPSTMTVYEGGSGYVVGDRFKLVGGTFDVAAEVEVTGILTTPTAGKVTTVKVVKNGSYSVIPTAIPVLTTTLTGVGTGLTVTPTWSGQSSNFYIDNTTIVKPGEAGVKFTGTTLRNINGTGYFGSTAQNGEDTIWEFDTTAPAIEILYGGVNTIFTVIANNQRVQDIDFTSLADGAQYYASINFGSSIPRSIRIISANAGFAAFRVEKPHTITKPNTIRQFNLGIGDSYMAAAGSRSQGSKEFVVANEIFGFDYLGRGIGGSGWGSGSTSDLLTRINNIADLNRVPDVVTFALGYNDATANTSDAVIESKFTPAIARVRELWPNAKILILSPATPLGYTANLIRVSAKLKALAAAANCIFLDRIDVVNELNKGIYTGLDQIHPSFIGHVYLGSVDAVLYRNAFPTYGV